MVSSFKLIKFPMDLGMGPLKPLLLFILSSFKLIKFPMD